METYPRSAVERAMKIQEVILRAIAKKICGKNLDIPGGFDALKAKVTGSSGMSLGKAVRRTCA